jgi:hypothetical protein
MPIRPSDLAKRLSDRRESEDGLVFRLPVDEARATAREILNQKPQGDSVTVLERWRQLSDGQIEFSIRRMQARDLKS